MKLLQLTALALLLQFPLSHAGCDGYEDKTYGRNFTPEIISIVAGAGAVGLGMNQIAQAANILWDESTDSLPLTHNNAATRKAAYLKIRNGLFAIGTGTALSIVGFSFLVASESHARSNCCNALPSNSTCNWNE